MYSYGEFTQSLHAWYLCEYRLQNTIIMDASRSRLTCSQPFRAIQHNAFTILYTFILLSCIDYSIYIYIYIANNFIIAIMIDSPHFEGMIIIIIFYICGSYR